MKRIASLLTLTVAISLCCSQFALGQNYLTATGSPSFSAPEPVELGFVESANGNLHLEIPLGSFPQRGSNNAFAMRLVYDSHIWQVDSGGNWSTAMTGNLLIGAGWLYADPIIGYVTATDYSPTGCGRDFAWTDATHTVRYFPLPNIENSAHEGNCATTGHAFATDSSGYHLYYSNTRVGPLDIYAPDGSLVYHGGYSYNGWETDTQGNLVTSKDTNGNYYSVADGANRNPVDTLGRVLLLNNYSTNTYDIANSQSSATSQADSDRSHYSWTSALIDVKTAFGQSGVTERTGQIRVLQSLTLPDGSSYQFKYDCDSSLNQACSSPPGQSAYYGTMTMLILPGGGTVYYGYTSFKDSYNGKGRWLTSRTVSGGGTWSYTPKVITNCGSDEVGCKQQLTVRKPSGDSTVYTFVLDNGAWPTQIESYSGGNLVSVVKNTWDRTQGCALRGCHGHGYIRKQSETATVFTPGGAITKQTQYTYPWYQDGLVSKVQEWKYYSGATPSFPSIADRTTNISYYSGGVNNINRPSTVTVCSSSGTDPDCPGGGSKISQTITTYDSYANICNASGLTQVSGIANHDDINFGSSYLTRGNPTMIQSWVSGSTYVTTQIAYDTTGQVTKVKDANGNCTGYGYDDSFYSDNGSNPPMQVSSPLPTNAYLTHVTFPSAGGTTLTQSFGYYLGSGKQARATDANNQSSYAHFMDPLDRPTGTQAPIGWSLIKYTSPTQINGYSPVDEEAPSESCTSCRRSQTTLDGFGRKTNQQLVNNPEGAVNVDTAYDPNGRVSAVSHPYTNVSNRVFERFAYDGLDRSVGSTHPDGQSLRQAYGATVTNLSGLTAQQAPAGTYGYGYPVVQMDEAGRAKQQWIDGFGNVIEVDEPGTNSGTPGSTTVTVNAGTLWYMFDPCVIHQVGGSPSCAYEVDNWGAVTFTVNGYSVTVFYNGNSQNGDTSETIAAGIAGALNTPGSPVTATASGANITITAVAPGASTNYSFSSSSTYNENMCDDGRSPCFYGGPSISPTSGYLSGGTGGPFVTPTSTFYKYDAANRLIQVVQGVQTRTFEYDGLGRITSALLPEASNTVPLGQMPQQCPVTFTYDSNGNVLTKTSPAPNQTSCSVTVTTQYCYDALDRVTGKAYRAQSCPLSSPAVIYTYDQGTNGLGRQTGVSDPSGSESYTYDVAGRIRQVQKRILATTYTIGYQLMVNGQLKQITYPSNRVVIQNHDSIGRLTSVTSNGINYTSGYTYDAEGHATHFNYGNGVSAAFAYSPDRSQLTNLTYASGSQTLLSLNYGYKNGQANCGNGTTTGNDGLIQCIQDVTGGPEAGRSVVYGYDSLARLTSAATAGSTAYPKWGLGWSYDRYGNRQSQYVTAGSAFSNSLVFAALPNGVGTYTNRPDTYPFDAIGNMLYDGVNNLTYDADNRITAIGVGGSSGAYIYDSSGTRVKKCVPNCTEPVTSTVFVYSGSTDIAEYDKCSTPSTPSREYIYAEGKLVATLTSTKTSYHHSDHLSVRVNTNENGQKIGEQGHYPYGEQWYAANATTKFIYTTYQRDNESGLDYAMARYYSSRLGRFCSIDPVGGSVLDPQSWNRYAYARNNPINATDPSGKFFQFIMAVVGAIMRAFVARVPNLSGVSLPSGSPGIWSEQIPGMSGGGLPPGAIIDERGGFGQGFMSGGAGNATPGASGGIPAFLWEALSNLRKNVKLDSKKCKKDLHDLNTTAEQVRQRIDDAQLINGIGSKVPTGAAKSDGSREQYVLRVFIILTRGVVNRKLM